MSILLNNTGLGGMFQGTGNFVPTRIGGSAGSGSGAINSLFSTILGFLTIAAGLTFLVFLIIGAFNWITAGGDQNKVDKAKNTLTNSAVGLIVIVSAYSIAWIVGTVLGIEILNPGKVLCSLGPNNQACQQDTWITNPALDPAYTNQAGEQSFALIFANLLRIAIVVSGFALLLYLIWGGLEWLTSGGDKNKVESARNRITNAVVGVVILVASVAIVTFLGSYLGLNILNPSLSVPGGP